MKLDEYISEMECSLAAFKKFWEVMSSDNAQNYPLTMKSGDWDEQFQHFCDLVKSETRP